MRTMLASTLFRHLAIFALVLLGLDLGAALAWAGGPPLADVTSLTSRAALFMLGIVTEVINDRARLIQASVFIVALGIAMLWWRK